MKKLRRISLVLGAIGSGYGAAYCFSHFIHEWHGYPDVMVCVFLGVLCVSIVIFEAGS